MTTSDSRTRAARAAVTGDDDAARLLLHHRDPKTRATALHSLCRMGRATSEDVAPALQSESSYVRRRALRDAIPFLDLDLIPLLHDENVLVAEQAAWALGERVDEPGFVDSDAFAITREALCDVATHHTDSLVREAAVGSLGSLQDAEAIPALLHALEDKPAIRRRAVIALTPFDEQVVVDAITLRLADHDWQVRQAAEDYLRES